MPGLVIPQRGMQSVSLKVATRIGSCVDFGCEWYRDGREGLDEGLPFRHPAGVPCGDHAGCRPCTNRGGLLCGRCEPCKSGTANCPCPQRLAWEIDQFGRKTGRRGHLMQNLDSRKPVTYRHATELGRREVVEDEWVTRLHEGTETYARLVTRGL